jgi:hypothetical protein
MRTVIVLLVAAVLSACSSSTDTQSTRYNFAVIDGANQLSSAGAPTLTRPITSQLAADPHGQFAWADLLLPTKAFAQSVTVNGTPIAGALVCANQSQPGEPQAVPLCAFTLADGKAPISVKGGTKAGTFTINFTAQVQSELPVMDSTTVTVAPGPMVVNGFAPGHEFFCFNTPATFPDAVLKDEFGNGVPYGFAVTGPAHVLPGAIGTAEARTIVADKDGQGTVQVVIGDGSVVASGKLTIAGVCVTLDF